MSSNVIVFETLVPTMHATSACVEAEDLGFGHDTYANIGIGFELPDGVMSISYRHAIGQAVEPRDLAIARDEDGPFGFGADLGDSVFASSIEVTAEASIGFFAELQEAIAGSGHFFMVGTGAARDEYDRGRAGKYINAGFAEELSDYGSGTTFVPYVASFLITQTPGHAHMEVLDDGIDYAFGISDTVRISSQLVTTLRILLRETLRMQSTMGTVGTLRAVLTDALKFNDRLAVMFMALLDDTIAFTDNVVLRINMIALVDALVLSGTMTTVLEARQLIASVLTLRDALDKKFVYDLNDDITLTDDLTGYLRSMFQLVDTMTLADDLVGTGSFVALLPDTIELGDSMATRMDAIIRLSDTIDLVCRLYTDNGERIAWAFNTVTSSTSKYENFSFNSVAELDGVLYASDESGFYALGSADDDGTPIEAYIETGLDTLGSTYQKRLVKSYLHFRSDGTMLVSYVSTESGVRKVETYRATPIIADDFRETSVDVPGGKKAVYWSFRISNENGSDFDLAGFYTIPLICGSRSDG